MSASTAPVTKSDDSDLAELLALPFGQILARLLAPRAVVADDWIDLRTHAAVPWRHAVAAAQRGELTLVRVGRRLLVKRSELDRWLQSRRIAAATSEPESPGHRSAPQRDQVATSRVDHILEQHGYRPRQLTHEEEDEAEMARARASMGLELVRPLTDDEKRANKAWADAVIRRSKQGSGRVRRRKKR